MTGTRPRSPSPMSGSPSAPKRAKKTHVPTSDAVADPTPYFAPDLLAPTTVHRLNTEYATSEPYKYCRVEKLFQDDLLVGVKDEIMSELSFTEKETDIYKVNQTGDLASLNYLTPEQIELLPNLLKLRDALYSPRFRAFLQAVTGCGPLSGSKQDMSVNTYTKGCHLLNHDDVIGTRRVSYILYMPLPHYQGWQPEWGGALELYPTVPGPDGAPEPVCIPSKSIPPSWNQFIFFEVQPGRSFHSVEEVVVGQGEDGRQRLSISGWFHAAQPGEEGYDPDEKYGEFKSSREQLTSTSTTFYPYPSPAAPPMPTDPLSEDHKSFLSEFLNPVYLQERTLATLASRFADESSLELHHFLNAALAEKLSSGLAANDVRDGLGPARERRIPPHAAGTRHDPATPDAPWELRGPPHKWRYCTLAAPRAGRREAVHPRSAAAPDAIVRSLQDELFPAPAFRAWLAKVSSVLPLSWAAAARRFRPGLDYTLATSEEKEARLDVVLGLTPEVPVEAEEDDDGARRRRRKEKTLVNGWQSGEWGGWECYMAPHEEEDDPAVYRSGSRKKSEQPKENGHANGNGKASPSSSPNGKKSDTNGKQPAHDDDEEDEEEDDGTLLTVQPGFNRLLLVLRDEKVMRFVKYVSAAAEGSRWDVCGEYEIGMLEEEEEEDEE